MEAFSGTGSRFEKQETGLAMSSLMPVGAGALLRHPSFLAFLLSRSFSRFASQIGAVAIGWQVYDLTGSAFDLGMIGLVQFLPTALLLFVAGHAADRYERRRVVQLCQVAEGLTALFLAWGAYAGWLTVTQIFIATFALGIAGAFESPALSAVLPGGAAALLPIYARDILETGPLGLGILRAAPAVGALMMTAFLAYYTINRRVGMRMFQAVIVFGAATVVFALSHWMWLSVLALAVLGAADTISVVIRFSLVQLATPDEMRGRVGAVNFLFINASNELGQFESGITAALFGAMPAAVLGGVGTIAIALLWMKLFPALRQVEKLAYLF